MYMQAEALCLPGLGLFQRKLRVHQRSVWTPIYFIQVQLSEEGEVYSAFHYCLNIWWPSGSSEETRTGKIIARILASVLKSLIWVWCCTEKLAPVGTSNI